MNQLRIPTANASAHRPGRAVLADFDEDDFDATDWDGTDDADQSGFAFDAIFDDADRRAHADAARALFAAR